MAQALMGKVRELAGDWDVVEVGGEWVGTVPAQVPREVAYVPVVERRLITKQVFLVMM
jgi:hypothetical protein